MSKDRTVATDALETLGMLIDETAARDAIHLAVEPVIAGQELEPGDRITLRNGKAYFDPINAIGVVDPFLCLVVKPGERFWLVLLPRQITSLRHVWTHPFFEEQERQVSARNEVMRKAEAENWVRNYLDSHGDNPGYEALYQAVRAGGAAVTLTGTDDDVYATIRVDDDYIYVNGVDAHGDITPEFWDKMEVIIGKPLRKRPSHFSCSC